MTNTAPYSITGLIFRVVHLNLISVNDKCKAAFGYSDLWKTVLLFPEIGYIGSDAAGSQDFFGVFVAVAFYRPVDGVGEIGG